MMNTRGWMLMAVGGGGGVLLDRVLRECTGDVPAVLAVDTDAAALAERAEVLLLGEARLEGAGTAGDVVSGRLSAQDDEVRLRQILTPTRVLILLTTLGGGTGSGASPEILRLARDAGIATLCFATLPFDFEPRRRCEMAARAVPVLEEVADALVVVPSERLFHSSRMLPLPVALDQAGRDLSRGVLLAWNMLTRSGYVRLDMSTLRAWLIQGRGKRHFAFAEAAGERRAGSAVEALLASPLLGDRKTLEQSRSILVGVLGGDDLRMQEIEVVMHSLKDVCRDDCRIDLGTVSDSRYNGRLAVVALVAETRLGVAAPESEPPSGTTASFDAERMSPPRRKRTSTAAKLSFGATGRGRFNGVEPTVFGGQDLDLPTYQRQGILLER